MYCASLDSLVVECWLRVREVLQSPVKDRVITKTIKNGTRSSFFLKQQWYHLWGPYGRLTKVLNKPPLVKYRKQYCYRQNKTKNKTSSCIMLYYLFRWTRSVPPVCHVVWSCQSLNYWCVMKTWKPTLYVPWVELTWTMSPLYS